MKLFFTSILFLFLFEPSIGQCFRKGYKLESIFISSSSMGEDYNSKKEYPIDSVQFYYSSSKKRKKSIEHSHAIKTDSKGDFFVHNQNQYYLIDFNLPKDSIVYFDMLLAIMKSLKGTSPERLYYGEGDADVYVTMLIDPTGYVIEKSMIFFGREFPKMKKKFMDSVIEVNQNSFKEEKGMLYVFSFSPYEV